MKPGDIVLAQLRQADGVEKLRPALLLCHFPPFDDWLLCGISTQIRHMQPGFDELLDKSAPDFLGSGPREASVIRLGFLGTLSESQIGGTLGRIHPERARRLYRNLSQHFACLGAEEL